MISATPGFSVLKSFLEHPARPEGTLRYHELQGFLFAVASSPEMIKPSEWLPIIFNEKEAMYASVEEANVVLGELMVLYNSINASAMSDRPTLPADCTLRPTVMRNFDDDAPIALWSRGFTEGHDWLEDVWEPHILQEWDREFGAILIALTFFSSRNLANAYLKESGRRNLNKMAAEVVEILPEAVAEYAHLGRSIDQALREREASKPTPVRRVKIGRNDPCPCGSGRKYKLCCGAVTH